MFLLDCYGAPPFFPFGAVGGNRFCPERTNVWSNRTPCYSTVRLRDRPKTRMGFCVCHPPVSKARQTFPASTFVPSSRTRLRWTTWGGGGNPPSKRRRASWWMYAYICCILIILWVLCSKCCPPQQQLQNKRHDTIR